MKEIESAERRIQQKIGLLGEALACAGLGYACIFDEKSPSADVGVVIDGEEYRIEAKTGNLGFGPDPIIVGTDQMMRYVGEARGGTSAKEMKPALSPRVNGNAPHLLYWVNLYRTKRNPGARKTMEERYRDVISNMERICILDLWTIAALAETKRWKSFSQNAGTASGNAHFFRLPMKTIDALISERLTGEEEQTMDSYLSPYNLDHSLIECEHVDVRQYRRLPLIAHTFSGIPLGLQSIDIITMNPGLIGGGNVPGMGAKIMKRLCERLETVDELTENLLLPGSINVRKRLKKNRIPGF